MIRRTAIVVGLALALGASGACSEDREEPAASGTTEAADEPTATCADDLVACARRSSLGDAVPDEATEATGEPLVLGMINQENTPAGSYPELSQAVQAAVELVNTQLGGVGGRPIEVEVCNTEFSAEGSTACAQRFVDEEVSVVLGGIDVFGTGIETLEANGIPYVGGIPVSDQSMTSPVSFQFSGGSWGASVAFAQHAATELGAERVAIVYGEFGSITDAAEYGRATLEDLGIEVQMVPMPVIATDLGAPLQAAASSDPDAVFVLTADTGCGLAFDAVAAVGLEAQMYYVGACAAPTIVESVAAERTEGAIFNVEGPIDRDDPDPDTALYTATIEAYGDGLDPIGAGTVTFRSFMNLWAAMAGLDDVTPDAVIDALREGTDVPSFMGHPYTCDGEQIAGLPAACSPQQILGRMEAQDLTQVGDWIDVGAVYPG